MILLSINYYNLIYTLLFGVYFILCFLVIQAMRIELLFKQGQVWQIRAMQIIISFILAYLLAQGSASLINSLQI